MTLLLLRLGHAEPCPEQKPQSLLSIPPEIGSALAKLDPEKKAGVLDGVFLFDVRKLPDAPQATAVGGSAQKLEATAVYPGNAPTAQLVIVDGLVSKLDAGTSKTGPMSLNDFRTSVKAKAANLDFESKLLLLSALGSRLKEGYDETKPNAGVSSEKVFQNARAGGKVGGDCKAIHQLLSEIAADLGLQDAGLHITLQGKPDPETAFGHMIAHFRNPKTNEYYLLNFGVVLKTNETKLTNAVDISTRVWGPPIGASYVKNQGTRIHLYQPRTARWIRGVLEGQATGFGDDARVRFAIGNRERTVGFDVFKVDQGVVAGKAFLIHSDVNTSLGLTSVTAAGVSGKVEKRWELKTKYLDEIGVAGQTYLGGMWFQAPRLNPRGKDLSEDYSRKSFFAGAEIKGMARINAVTGYVELKASAIDNRDITQSKGKDFDGSSPMHWIKVGAKVQATKKLSVDVSRNFEIVPKSMTSTTSVQMQTAYDKVTVVYDTREGAKQAYLIVGGEAYLMEGVEKLSAVGLKAKIKAAIPAGDLGDFYITGEISGVPSNKSKDAFYDAETAWALGGGYTKSLTQAVQIGASVDATKGRPYFLFEGNAGGWSVAEHGPRDTPVLSGQVWTRLSW